MDKDLLKQLPQCEGDEEDLCDIDPSKLLLEHVSRHFHGNFSCIGMNAAGPSPMSDPIELVVLYPPGTVLMMFDGCDQRDAQAMPPWCGAARRLSRAPN